MTRRKQKPKTIDGGNAVIEDNACCCYNGGCTGAPIVHVAVNFAVSCNNLSCTVAKLTLVKFYYNVLIDSIAIDAS